MRIQLATCLLGVLVLGCDGERESSSADGPVAPTPVSAPVPSPAPLPPSTPFQGTWSGLWTRQQCTESGGAVGVGCNIWPTNGAMTVTLTQSGTTAQGTVQAAAYLMDVSGPISTSNELMLSGQGQQGGATVNLTDWRTTLNGNLMVGSFSYTVATDDVRLGSITVTASLQDLVKQ